MLLSADGRNVGTTKKKLESLFRVHLIDVDSMTHNSIYRAIATSKDERSRSPFGYNVTDPRKTVRVINNY